MANSGHTDRSIGLSGSASSGASHWTSLLTNTGSQMAILGSRMVRLGKEKSIPDHRDLSQMMQLGTHLMHVGSLFQKDASEAITPVATTPSSKRRTSVMAKPNKQTRFSFVAESQPEPESLQVNPLTQFTLSPVLPFSSAHMIDASPLDPDDELDMMQLGTELMHVGSLFPKDASEANTPVASTPSSKRRPSVLAKPNKRTRFSFVAASQPKPESFQVNPLTRLTLSPVLPFSSAHMIDASPLDPDDELDEYLWSIFSESFGRSSFVINDFAAADGASTSSTDRLQTERHAENHSPDIIPSTDKNRRKGVGRYLKKFVANTHPKMTLKAYFERHDSNLICLCGRGAHNKHPGNKNYRDFVSSWSKDYRCLSKEEKEERTNSAVQEFESQGRRIFKLNRKDEWEELDEASARAKIIRTKISQRFRDS